MGFILIIQENDIPIIYLLSKEGGTLKKLLIILALLLNMNIAHAATLDIETGRNLIINNERICLDIINQVNYSYSEQKTIFLLSTGETRAFPTTYDEYVKIQQLVFSSRAAMYNQYYNYNRMYYNPQMNNQCNQTNQPPRVNVTSSNNQASQPTTVNMNYQNPMMPATVVSPRATSYPQSRIIPSYY